MCDEATRQRIKEEQDMLDNDPAFRVWLDRLLYEAVYDADAVAYGEG